MTIKIAESVLKRRVGRVSGNKGIFFFFFFFYGLNCFSINGVINEPGHEKMCLMSYANNKGADQPAHPRSLISTFVVRCLDSIMSLDSLAEISRL